jgi:transcriptional regulator with XRE-family HTH domain
MADLNAALTELLRDMRREAGLTGLELCRRLGWKHKSSVSQYENGLMTPKLEMVGRWAAACGYHAELRVYRDETRVLSWAVPLNPRDHDA